MPKKMTAKQKQFFGKGHAPLKGGKKAAKSSKKMTGKTPKKGAMPY